MKRLKQQILKIQTMGLTVYCETQCGQYRRECEAISAYQYHEYVEWAKGGNKWGHQKLQGDENGVTFVVSLPNPNDGQSLVSLCSGLAMACVVTILGFGNFNIQMASRLSGVIFANLQWEDIEEKEAV